MKIYIPLVLLVVLAGCSPQIRVYSDQDPDYDLWTYSTFGWGERVEIEKGKNPFHYNELNDKRIKSAVQQEMVSRGYSLGTQEPELVVHYHIVIEDQSVVTTEPFGYLYGPHWSGMHTNTYTYREGTLIVDIMDRKTKNLVWRGWAVSAIDNVDPEKVDKLIKTAVARVFKKFPGQSRKNPKAQGLTSR